MHPDKEVEPLQSLVLRALEKGYMIHGGAGKEEGVYSVMISVTTKRTIMVMACGTDPDHETALRYALTHALERGDSGVVHFPGKKRG